MAADFGPYIKQLSMLAYACNPGAGEAGTGTSLEPCDQPV